MISVASAVLAMYYISDNTLHSGQISPQATRRRVITAYDNAAYEETTTATSVSLHGNPMYVGPDSDRTVGNPIYSSNTSSPHYANTSDSE